MREKKMFNFKDGIDTYRYRREAHEQFCSTLLTPSVRAHLSISPSSPFSPWLNTPSWVSTLSVLQLHTSLDFDIVRVQLQVLEWRLFPELVTFSPFDDTPLYTIKTQGKLPGGIDGSTYTPYARGQVLPYRNIRPFLTRSAIHGHRNTVFFQW